MRMLAKSDSLTQGTWRHVGTQSILKFCQEQRPNLGITVLQINYISIKKKREALSCSLTYSIPQCPLLTKSNTEFGKGDGTPLQYSCLENPMDRGAW